MAGVAAGQAARTTSNRGSPAGAGPGPARRNHPHLRRPEAAFDLAVAVRLAGHAFQAYEEPRRAGGAGGEAAEEDGGGDDDEFVEDTLNGTRARYLSAEALRCAFAGRLRVRLKRASGLPAADPWGTSDPYCILTLSGGDGTARSRTVARTVDPAWDEELTLLVGDPEAQVLQVRLYDADLLGPDDDLGVAQVPLRGLGDGAVRALRLPVQASAAGAELELELQFAAFPADDDADNGDPAGVAAGGGALADCWAELTAAEPAVGDGADCRPAVFVENDATDTQCWIFRDAAAREVVVAFRGTEQTKWQDLATDVNLTPSTIDPERVVDDGSWLPFLNRKREPLVHGGFLAAYDSVRVKVLNAVAGLTADADGSGAGRPWTVLVTGHSLGGALATLFALEAASLWGDGRCANPDLHKYMPKRDRSGAREVCMYNFGSPRVGNAVFADGFDDLVPDAWRITNKKDIIPTVPRMLGFKHVGERVLLDAGGITTEDDQNVFEEADPTAVVDEVAKLWTSSDEAARRKIEKLVEKELEILATLQDGSAILEHLEDFYLETLTVEARKKAN